MVSWHGFCFQTFDRFRVNLGRFAYIRNIVFEVIFTFLYAFEQILLILFTYTSKNVEELGFVISSFAIIVLTTFALQKLVMESRIRTLETELTWLHQEKGSLQTRHADLQNGYNTLIEFTSKYLYNRTTTQNKAREVRK